MVLFGAKISDPEHGAWYVRAGYVRRNHGDFLWDATTGEMDRVDPDAGEANVMMWPWTPAEVPLPQDGLVKFPRIGAVPSKLRGDIELVTEVDFKLLDDQVVVAEPEWAFVLDELARDVTGAPLPARGRTQVAGVFS